MSNLGVRLNRIEQALAALMPSCTLLGVLSPAETAGEAVQRVLAASDVPRGHIVEVIVAFTGVPMPRSTR